MMRLDDRVLRELALRAVARHATAAASPTTVAAGAVRAFDELVAVCSRLIGQVGVRALTNRALHLVEGQYPWLASLTPPAPGDSAFPEFVSRLSHQAPEAVTEVTSAVLALHGRLLLTFIGNALTAKLLQEAWPEAWSAAAAEELQR